MPIFNLLSLFRFSVYPKKAGLPILFLSLFTLTAPKYIVHMPVRTQAREERALTGMRTIT